MTKATSLIEQVAALIAEAGQGTTDDILPDCPGWTRAQVMFALQNAKRLGHVITTGHMPRVGRFAGLSIYAPAPRTDAPRGQIRPASSVWEYARCGPFP